MTKAVRAGLLGAVLSLLVGCSEPRQPLQLGTNVWPGYEPLYLARALGYLDADSIQLVELLSASEVIRAYRNGALDVAALTLDEALLVAQESEVQVLLVTDISSGADAILMQQATSMQALRGCRVGVETTALGAYLLSRALQKSGMSMDDIEPVPLESSHHEQAFLAGEVDAVVTFEPIRSRLLEQGAQVVFDSSQLPNEVIDVLVIRPGLIDSYPDELRHLVQAWYASLDHLEQHPQEAAALMSRRLRMPPEQVIDSLHGLKIPHREENLALLYGEQQPLLQQAQRLNRIMLEEGLVERRVDLSRFIVERGQGQ